MMKNCGQGGILPPFALVFPPFAYGAGRALSAVGIVKILNIYKRAFFSRSKKASYTLTFSTFSTFCPNIQIFEVKRKRVLLIINDSEFSRFLDKPVSYAAIAFIIQSALARLNAVNIIEASSLTTPTSKHGLNGFAPYQKARPSDVGAAV